MNDMNKPFEKRRRVTRSIIAVVCCMVLLLAGGFAGAKINEAAIQHKNNSVQAYSQANETQAYDSANNTPAYSQANNTQAYGPVNEAQADDPVYETQTNDASGIDDTIGSSYASLNPLGSVNPSGDTLSLTDLFAGANLAVVAISTEMTGRNAFGSIVTQPAAGSGFIISEDGFVVTNNHVVEDATSISVLMYDGTKYSAVLVGRDPISDLAVLKIDADNLSFLSLGNSEILLVGEQVAAIGNPLGEFANSMTVGYISALDREINIDGTPRIMLQTDAAVNSGNSGGPLLNMKGQVIGIVTAKSIGSDVEGLGFAIPSSKAKIVIEQLIDIGITDGYGYVRKQAVMGVTVSTLDEDGNIGVLVESVNNGSAAETAGIREGDVILSANGKTTNTVNELKEIINALFPGDKLTLNVLRGGKEIYISVILDEYIPTDDGGYESRGGVTPYYPDNGSEFPFDPWGMFPGMDEMYPYEDD